MHEETHTNEKAYECQICSMKFVDSISLTSHERIHKKQKLLHRCKTCGKCFSRGYGLKQHEFTHATELAFQCPICFIKFKSPHGVSHHVKKVHAKDSN